MLKLCRLVQAMSDDNQATAGGDDDPTSLLQMALKNEITAELTSAVVEKEREVTEKIEKEEEEARLEAIRIETERKEEEERVRLKREAALKKKEEKERLDRLLALKSLDEMVKYFSHFLGGIWLEGRALQRIIGLIISFEVVLIF